MLLEKMGASGTLKLLDTETFIMVTKDGKPKITRDYSYVELKRQEGVYTFEEWLENEIKALMS